MKYWAAVLTSLLAAPVAAEPARVLVAPFENTGGNESVQALEDGLADMTTACLSRHPSTVQVLDRSVIESLLRERSLAWTNLLDPSTTSSDISLQGAEYLISGSFSAPADELTISLFLHDLSSTRLVEAMEAEVLIAEFADRICEALADPIVLSLSETTQTGDPLPSDSTPEITQNMIVGMGHYYTGNYAEAFPAFLKILSQNQEHAAAQFWLTQSFFEAGLFDLAEVQGGVFLDRFGEHDRARRVEEILRDIRDSSQGE